MYRFVIREECPVCGADNASGRYARCFNEEPVAAYLRSYYGKDTSPLAGGMYDLAECGRCALIFQRHVGDREFLNELYTNWLKGDGNPERDPTYNADLRDPLSSRDGHELVAAAAYLGKPLAQLRTLDYGMGWALWARISLALGCHSYGSDLAENRMAFARQAGVKPVTEAEIPDQCYDFINCEQVFEHVPDPAGLARRMAGALAPGGILKISVPSGERASETLNLLERGASQWTRDRLMPIHPLEHINCFRNQTIGALAARSGLREVRPGLTTRYAFLLRPGSLDVSRPRKLLKELARPVWQFRSRSNLYRWLQRPTAA
jgi:2-polyprenyl-3-methyl-5-hydroxy-6-metoxy-1,4-benzoquinol methylase